MGSERKCEENERLHFDVSYARIMNLLEVSEFLLLTEFAEETVRTRLVLVKSIR